MAQLIPSRVLRLISAVLLALPTACTEAPADEQSPQSRSAGHTRARLQPADAAAAYVAALREAFEINSGLVLLLDPAILPRAGGYATSVRVPEPHVRALLATDAIRGVCRPDRPNPKYAPRCDVPSQGYAIRVSDIFQLAADTMQLYLTAERFTSKRDTSGYHPAFAFEERYRLLRRGNGWTVLKKERKML